MGATTAPMLHIDDIAYRIAGRLLIDGASLALQPGMHVGLIGRNGTGKTTLLDLISGDLASERGAIRLPKGARMGRVLQEAPGGEQTLIEHVLEADTERAGLLAEAETSQDAHRISDIHARLEDIDAHAAPARAAIILAGLGFDEAAQGRPLSAFSGGWRMRVALAAVLFTTPDVLLLDEPTNYLDLEGTLWLQAFLAGYPHATIIVSHDRDLLNASVDHIAHLSEGRITLYRGGYDSFERQRAERQALQAKLKKKQDEERRHIEAFVERFRAKASKARQAQSRIKALERMRPIAASVEGEMAPLRFPEPARALSPPIVRMEAASVGYAPDAPVLSRLSLRVDEDDRVGLLGANGNGKSTFAKLLSGKLDPLTGEIWRADGLSVAYFAQHQLDELDPARSPYQAVRALMPEVSEARARAATARLGFGANKADTPAEALSGGEKARLLLGLATFHGPNLLILDEPTNHLDIDAREALAQALNAYSGAVILISHDRHLLDACVDRFWLIADGGVRPFDGDLDAYRDRVLGRTGGRTSERAGGRDKPRPNESPRQSANQARRRLAPLRETVRRAEAEIERMHKAIALIDAKLAAPDLFAKDPARGGELARKRSEAEKRIAAAEAAWLEASAAIERQEAGPGA